MDLNKLTIKAQQVVSNAQTLALGEDHQAVETGHILSELIANDESVWPFICGKLSANAEMIKSTAQQMVASYPKVSGGDPYLSSNAKKALAQAFKQAGAMKDEYVSIEHIIYGLVASGDQVSKMLKDAGFEKDALLQAISELRKGSKVNSADPESTYNSLDKYAINLNGLASKGKLDPVIGRDEEIRRVLQILTRRSKNNPILIGEPGVGKTAIAEGIAHRIVRGDVPENLQDKLVYALDMGALLAGAKYKGEFEERLKAVVNEVIASDGQIVLFIDEIHTLVGAGGGQGAMDAANILKPALARGELRAVGATTLDEYQKHFEKDKALVRRFQTVLIDEPSTEDAISILRGIKEKYENYHKVLIKDSAIISAVELSQRYITERFLPDKAIDLIDEAASKLRMEINSKPVELDEIERKIMQLEIEREAIKREGDKAKLDSLGNTLAELNDQKTEFLSKWEAERNIMDKIQEHKGLIETYKLEAEKAEREGDFGKVAELRYGKISESESALENYKQDLVELQSKSKMIKDEVDTDEIAEVVAKWTGIPVSKMLESERSKLLRLEDELEKRVVGQSEAVAAVADAVRRSRAGLQDQKRPIGSFVFLGTTGVGKTELAKALTEFLFNDENALTRIDMSEYQEKHTVSRLVGAPPGYVGYEEGGQLTEAVRRRPYSVVLLDEIEKAHPDVFNILLQVLDDGRLTDNKGRVVNFKNTIIIMTSNIGADIIQAELSKLNADNAEYLINDTKNKVFELMKKSFRPEFLNRIDEQIMFTPLSEESIHRIVKIQLHNIIKRMNASNIRLEFSDALIKHIAEIGYDPVFGARPVNRVIQQQVMNPLSKEILAGNVSVNDSILLDCNNGVMISKQSTGELA